MCAKNALSTVRRSAFLRYSTSRGSIVTVSNERSTFAVANTVTIALVGRYVCCCDNMMCELSGGESDSRNLMEVAI